MSQAVQTLVNQSGASYRAASNASRAALLTQHKGALAPTYGEAGTIWVDDSATPWVLRVSDGGTWITMGTIDPAADTFTPSIPVNALTNAMLADMAAATIKGSIAGGDPADLTPSQARGILEIDTQVIAAAIGADQNDYAIAGVSAKKNVTTLLRVTPSGPSIILTGIDTAGWEDGKRIVIRNAGDPLSAGARMILLPRESASSTAANRFSYTPMGMPIILMPGDCAEFVYSATASRIEFVRGSRHGSMRQFFDTFSDFGNTPGDMGMSNSGTSSGGNIPSVFVGDATQKAIGMWGCATGTTNTGRAYMGSSSSQMKGGSGSALFLGRFAPEVNLSTLAERYAARAGFHDAGTTGAVVDGIYWEYDEATSGDWRVCATNNSVSTKHTVTGFTVSTATLHYLGIFANGDWSNIEFFYSADGENWTIFATAISTNIPTAAGREFGAQFGLTKSAGTTSRNFDSDWMGWRYDAKRGA